MPAGDEPIAAGKQLNRLKFENADPLRRTPFKPIVGPLRDHAERGGETNLSVREGIALWLVVRGQ